MRKELLYNPRLVLERIAELSKDRRRLAKLINPSSTEMGLAHITSMEFLELAQKNGPLNIIYDLGANLGTWTILAKSVAPDSVVYAFEPLANYQEKFLENTRKLGNIHLQKVAVGSKNGTETFNVAGHSSSFLEVSEFLISMFPSEKKTSEVQIEMVRLDDFVKRNKLPWPDFMKLDVEGYELEVLKHAIECMAHTRYMILEVSFVERHINQPLFHDIVHFLAEHNFHLHAFPVRMHLAQKIIVADVLFENQAFLKK